MPIQEENIVFVESQVMDDVPEGGGAATGRVIQDGELNNVFEDISDLDRAYGRFNLRKAFLAVRSLDTSLYGGAKLVVTALPSDPALDYALFTTEDPFDTRSTASNRVASYLYKGPMYHGALYENHISGMRQIRLIQRVGTALPPVGKTLFLVQYEDASNEKGQYVRVVRVQSEVQTFTDDKGDYQRLIVSLDLSDSLRFNFTGHTVSRTDDYDYVNSTRVRDTTVADAAQYYGSRPLAEAASIGDLGVKASSLFATLVPSAQTETPMIYQAMNPDRVDIVDAGGGHTVEVTQSAHTLSRDVTIENRRLNWIETLRPRPRSGTLTVAFMALGEWYVLYDNGDGTLSAADPAAGTGTIDYETGTVAVTLGALPDATSQIFWTYSSPVHYRIRIGTYPATNSEVRIELGEPVEPESLQVQYLSGDVTQTAEADVGGTITGGGTGYVSHSTGSLRFLPNANPDPNTQLRVTYSPQSTVQLTLTDVEAVSGIVNFDLGEAIKPGSLCVRWTTEFTKQWSNEVNAVYKKSGRSYSSDDSGSITNRINNIAYDDGAGSIVDESGIVVYSTGQVTLPVLPEMPQTVYETSLAVPELNHDWIITTEESTVFTTNTLVIEYIRAEAAAQPPISIDMDWPEYYVKVLPPLVTEQIVPGSLRFTMGSVSYKDLGTGILYNAANVAVGTIDYTNGIATLTLSGGGAPNVTSCLTRFGQWVATEASFRSQTAPLKPEALSIVVTTEDGEQLAASADAAGAIIGPDILGFVNYQFGTAQIAFGHFDTDGVTWIPRRVDPSTLRYNAVSYSYLPLDADILGIDPVRLPSDGRVPIYRPGDIVQVLHTATNSPITPTINSPISVGRTRLAWARVIDADGLTVSGDRYELDRATGQIMFTDLTDVSLPVTIKHTVGDLRMVTDAQISGYLTLSRPLTHDYPAGESLVASCLIFGDRRARVSAVWDQSSWDGTWQDSIKGSEATATLNTIDFPITVTNEGADTDRWIFRCTNASTHQWELISEKRGLVWSGTYQPYVSGDPVDVRPINPRTRVDLGGGAFSEGTPYMVIPQRANGGGWSTGNVVRINTVGAIADFWIARSIQQSDEPLDPAAADGCEIYALGNIDRPNE